MNYRRLLTNHEPSGGLHMLFSHILKNVGITESDRKHEKAGCIKVFSTLGTLEMMSNWELITMF